MSFFERHIFVCINQRAMGAERGSCARTGGLQIRAAFQKQLARHCLLDRVRANKSMCLDYCEQGPVVVIYPEQVWYGGVTLGDVSEIVESHVMGGKIVERLLIPGQQKRAQALITLQPSSAKKPS